MPPGAATALAHEAFGDQDDSRTPGIQLVERRRQGAQAREDDLRTRGRHSFRRVPDVLSFELDPRRVLTLAAVEALHRLARGSMVAREADVRHRIERFEHGNEIGPAQLFVDEARDRLADPFRRHSGTDVILVEQKREQTRSRFAGGRWALAAPQFHGIQLLDDAVLDDLEVFRPEIQNGLAVPVGYYGVEPDHEGGSTRFRLGGGGP